MKKLLSILASLGLTATASTAVVACSSVRFLNNVTVSPDGIVTFKINGLKINKDSSLDDLKNQYGIFENNESKTYVGLETLTPSDSSLTTFKKNKKYVFVATFKIPATYKTAQNCVFVFGTKDENNKLVDTIGTVPFRWNPPVTPEDIAPTPNPTPAKQAFAVATAEATFAVVPTSDQLAEDFAVKDNAGNPIDGVTYKFVQKDQSLNKSSFAVNFASISGIVEIKVPVPAPKDGEADDQPAPKIKVETTPAAEKNGLSGFDPSKVSVSKPFIVNGVNLSGSLIESSFTDGKHTSKTSSYVTLGSIIAAISADKDVKAAVVKALEINDADLNKDNNNLTYRIATGVDINKDNVSADYSSDNGTIIPSHLVIPNGSSYQVEVSINNKHFWMNLGFNKNVTGKTAAKSEISNIKFNGYRELTADVTNMSGYAGLNSIPVAFANLVFKITKANGTVITIPYTQFSAYGIKLPLNIETTTNNGMGIGADSAFSNGKLDLLWGDGPNQSWHIANGDKVSISYTDFTGATVSKDKTADGTDFDSDTIIMNSKLVENLVNPDGTANVKSFLNKEKVLNAVRKNTSLSNKINDKFGTIDSSKLNYKVVSGMNISGINFDKPLPKENGLKEYPNRMVVPNGTEYQIGIYDDKGNYYWFNANFDDSVTNEAPKKSDINNIRFVGAREVTADLSNMNYGGLSEIAPTFANLQFKIGDQVIPYTYDSSFEDNSNPDFNNHGDGLSWRSIIKDGKLDLKWGNGPRNSWWLYNGEKIEISYTDFTGNRVDKETTVDFSNPETDQISFSGDLIDNKPFENDNVNAKSYLSTTAVLDKITNDENMSKDAYTSLFGWDTKGKSFRDALKERIADISFEAAQGMTINYNTAYKEFDPKDGGRLIPISLVIPDGEDYQIGLHSKDGKYFWLNATFKNKIVDKNAFKQSQISNIRFVGGRELTADISNMSYGEMNAIPLEFAKFSITINGTKIPYTEWSTYGDKTNPDSTNHGDGISWRPLIKDGKLDLIWGKWWNINNGDKIHIEYTDFTGNTVKCDSVVDFSNPELDTITLSGDLLDNKYTDGKQDVDRKSYINTEAIINEVSQDEYKARDVYSSLFGWNTDGKSFAEALKAKENEISFDVAKGMIINKDNAYKAYDGSGKLLASRLAIPDGSKYQIGLKTKSGAHFWINMSFDKKINDTAKESQITDIKLGDSKVNHGRSLDMDVSNMSFSDMNDITPVFADLEFKINGERIPYTTWSAIGDQTNPDWNPWNTGNGIGVMSRFQNGKLHLEWGPGNNNSWFLGKGKTIQISYTDFTGKRVDTGILLIGDNGVMVSQPELSTSNGKTLVKARVYGLANGYVPAWDSMKFYDTSDPANYVWASDKNNKFSFNETTKEIEFTFSKNLVKGHSYEIKFKAITEKENDSHNTNTWYHSESVIY